MSVERILKGKGHDVITAQANQPLAKITELLCRHGIGAVVLVSGDGRIAGIISERDVVRACNKAGADWQTTPASEAMTREVVTCRKEDEVTQIMSLMTNRRIRHVPVVDDKERLVGLVSIGDVVKSRLAMIEREAEEMLRYISG